jgi:hypothetical protein
MTMNDHDDIEPEDERDPGCMSADERRARPMGREPEVPIADAPR